GIVRLLNKMNPKQKRIVPLDTQSKPFAEIPIEDLPHGKWRAFCEWEYDGRDYYYEEDFEVA
ncbi:MAG: hypothetical protein ACXVB6_16975, partial [Mucilaginibacter sp.]